MGSAHTGRQARSERAGLKLTSREWRCGDERADGECPTSRWVRSPQRCGPDLNLRGAAIHLYAAYPPVFEARAMLGHKRNPQGLSCVDETCRAHTVFYNLVCSIRGSSVPYVRATAYGTHTTHTQAQSSVVCVTWSLHTVCSTITGSRSPSRGRCPIIQSASRPLIRPRPWDGLYLPHPPLAQSYPPTSRPPAQAQARAAQRRQPQRAPPSRCPH